jgi:hypothetical protein
MNQQFRNNAWSFLNGGINDVTTSILLTTGTGNRFPSPTGSEYFLLTLIGLDGTVEDSWEIVKVTARAGDVLTVERGQEGTTAATWSTGARIEMRLTAGSMETLQTDIDGKADNNHSHVESDITDLDKYTQAEVDAALSGKAATGHQHTEADITDLGDYAKNARFHITTAAPEGSDGNNDDIWYQV